MLASKREIPPNAFCLGNTRLDEVGRQYAFSLGQTRIADRLRPNAYRRPYFRPNAFGDSNPGQTRNIEISQTQCNGFPKYENIRFYVVLFLLLLMIDFACCG